MKRIIFFLMIIISVGIASADFASDCIPDAGTCLDACNEIYTDNTTTGWFNVAPGTCAFFGPVINTVYSEAGCPTTYGPGIGCARYEDFGDNVIVTCPEYDGVIPTDASMCGCGPIGTYSTCADAADGVFDLSHPFFAGFGEEEQVPEVSSLFSAPMIMLAIIGLLLGFIVLKRK